MIRVFVVYEGEVDPDRYAQHAELCRRVPEATFRHGKVLRTLHGEPQYRYYAEFEFADEETFKRVGVSEEMRATGKDTAEMGVPHSVYAADVS